ncbi:MAG: beta-glucoside-specific PTS transporter subunit IIABC [Propionibacteriaceae bacterium]|nr:beta-glucoside-specific PTS transporter subunit IIABC [Propionibacteriaceae bacterium]
MAVDFDKLADDIVMGVGGVANIKGARHCATRVRMELRDESKANTEAIKALPGVVTVVQSGGQYQVVIGNDVPQVFAGISAQLEGIQATDSSGGSRNLLDAFIELVSSLFHPILWPLAGAGLYKAFLALFVTLGWVDATTTGYAVLSAASDALIYFLPILLALTAAKRFKANQYTAAAIAGALVYPSVVALSTATEPLTFFGLPLVVMNYSSSVLPIIVGVWIQGYLERFLAKALPGAIRNFTVPLVSMLVMVPLILLTVGPVSTYAASLVAGGITQLYQSVPWLAGTIMGGLWQVLVIFGLHWGLIPVMLLQLNTEGYTVLTGALLGAVLAQAAAAFAVMVRTKDPETRKLAGPSALSGLLAGITEPAIYGVNLPRKLPFYFGLAGGAAGGILAGLAGGRTTAFVFPSLVGIPGYLGTPNLPLLFIGVAIAMVIGFGGTWLWGVRDEAAPAAGSTTGVAAPGAADVTILSPMSGRTVALAGIPDPVFASGAMGDGVGIVPSSGTVVAPVSGELVVVMDTGHAYGLRTDEGVEVLVHVGIDTVSLKGAGFVPKAAKGDRVNAGDVLALADLEAIKAAGYDTTTVLVVTSTPAHRGVTVTAGSEIEAAQPVLTVAI